jgi:hypothetical protein
MEDPTPALEAPGSPAVASVRERRCGRCQLTFPCDAGQHASAQIGWWLCPPCHEKLLGHQGRARS